MNVLLNKVQSTALRQYRQCLFRYQTYHTKFDVFGHKAENPRTTFQVPEDVASNRIKNSNLFRLVSAYRQHGHRKAAVDPLGLMESEELPELDAAYYGLTDFAEEHNVNGILHTGERFSTLGDIMTSLKNMYCGPLTAEFSHLHSSEEQEWFAEQFEAIQEVFLSNEEKVEMAKLMLRSQAFDNFLASKFGSVKRYGGEGGESAMLFYQELFKTAAYEDINDVLICIAHRGRLNLLTCLLELPPALMFRKMKGKREFPPGVVGAGDVLSHLTNSVDLKYDDKNVHVTMIPNPSQLEACNPVLVGKTRSRQQSLGTWQYSEQDASPIGAMCLQIHGDAAFTGQGVVAELFAMADVPHYEIGGSVHFIVNNQIGYTTEQHRGRSSLYASCMAKTNGCPVIRVNAEYPEEVIRACRLAMAYKLRFEKDVIVDFVCYRKSGHNEMDEPAFTQPIMYNVIRSKASIPDMYSQALVDEGIVSQSELNANVSEWQKHLAEQHAIMDDYVPKANHLEKQWSGFVQAPASISTWDTGVSLDTLRFIGAKSVEAPKDMELHPTIVKTHMKKRLQSMEDGADINWATAEALAMGSLMYQGYNVRISGQDVGRGTFSQRHAMLVDQQTDAIHIPLNHMTDTQTGKLEIANSILSEEAVLGFEYGVSIENPNILPIWEAQFGDFFTGAQIIIDTLVSGGETKWLQQSGVTLLLPHGMDGAGPEHSSARPERFLQLTDSKEDGIDGDDVNMQVVNPSTPAQYFHVLRRQMVRNFRKPLVVMGPKMLLRHPSCVSRLSDMAPGTSFRPVLGDCGSQAAAGVSRVVCVSGKHYYTLDKHRQDMGITDTAIIRLESLCPFPADELRNEFAKFPNAKDFIWAQEEHRNAGGWNFVAPRFENVVGKKLRYVGRGVHATPAVGVGDEHRQEADDILRAVFQ